MYPVSVTQVCGSQSPVQFLLWSGCRRWDCPSGLAWHWGWGGSQWSDLRKVIHRDGDGQYSLLTTSHLLHAMLSQRSAPASLRARHPFLSWQGDRQCILPPLLLQWQLSPLLCRRQTRCWNIFWCLIIRQYLYYLEEDCVQKWRNAVFRNIWLCPVEIFLRRH